MIENIINNIPKGFFLGGVGIILLIFLSMIIFREKIAERIESNAVKSTLTWVDKRGQEYSEEVLLKKSKMPLIGDWTRIYPPYTEDRSKIIWTNLIFGSKQNLIKLIIILAIVLMVLLQFGEIFNYLDIVRSNACVQQCLSSIPIV